MRRLKYNSDYMSRQMDKELEALEDRLKAIYANASYDVNAEFAKFAKTFEAKDAEMAKMVAEGSMTEAEYSLWRQRQILQTDLYKASVDKMTVTMLNADITAMATINGDLPMVVAQSYNFVQSLGWKKADDAGLSVGTFQIYNADSVQTIIRDNPDLLKSVDIPVDKKWNKEKINNEIVSSIMKGDPIPKVAENLQKVAKMDENSAIRNARTAMTSAENLGRSESADRLKSQGIPVNEVWNATYDSRTRDTHLMLDGTMRDENGYFGADFLTTPLRYPADPLGDPEEVYNCRCRMSVVLEGIDHSQDGDLYEEFMKSQHPDDWEKMQENKGYQAKQEVIQGALERKEILLQNMGDVNPRESEQNPSDYVAEKNADVPSGLEARAEEIGEMTYSEIFDAFVDNPDSYVYSERYQQDTEQIRELRNENDRLKEEKQKLEEEFSKETREKPKSEWTEDERLYYEIIGEKPLEYTDRGYEVEKEIREISKEVRENDSKISDLRDDLDLQSKTAYWQESSEWLASGNQYDYEKGDVNKEYEGISTTMSIKEFDQDLAEGIGFIAEMSPDEYLDRIAFEIFNTSRESAIVCDYSNVQKYAKMISEGVKFDMGYLDYDKGGQEGRHRAMACKLLGIEKIPVYIRGRSI